MQEANNLKIYHMEWGVVRPLWLWWLLLPISFHPSFMAKEEAEER
jgi:hypothetical protein